MRNQPPRPNLPPKKPPLLPRKRASKERLYAVRPVKRRLRPSLLPKRKLRLPPRLRLRPMHLRLPKTVKSHLIWTVVRPKLEMVVQTPMFRPRIKPPRRPMRPAAAISSGAWIFAA